MSVVSRRRTFKADDATPKEDLERVRKLEEETDRERCVDCTKKLIEEGIECDYCDRWYHIKCQRINTKTIKVLEREGVRWYCYRCEIEVKKMNEQV